MWRSLAILLITALISMALVVAIVNHVFSTCSTHTVWYGAEVNNATASKPYVVTWPVRSNLTITNIGLSTSFAPTNGGPPGSSGATGFQEALILTGVEHGSNSFEPYTGNSGAFGGPLGYTGNFHGNQPDDSVFSAIILKTNNGLAANESITNRINVPVNNKENLYLYFAVAIQGDVEAQINITYKAC